MEKQRAKYGKGGMNRIPTDEKQTLRYWEFSRNADIHGETVRVKSTSTLADRDDAKDQCLERWHENVQRRRGSQPKKPPQKRKKGKPAPGWTIEQYSERWFDHVAYLSKDRKHYHRQRLNDHVLPYIGHIEMGELSPTDCEHLLRNTLVQKGLGDFGRAGVRKTLSQMLRHAREREHPPVIYHNPVRAEFAPTPKGRKREETDLVWERAAVAQQMLSQARDASQGGAQPFLHLWLRLNYMGLRRGEVSGLTWDKVKTGKNGTIKVHAQYLYRREWGGTRYTPTTKSEAGRREFGLTPQLNAALIAWRQEQSHLKALPGWKQQERDFVLTHKDGRPFSGNDQQKYWTDYKAEFFKDYPELKEAVEAGTWVQHFNRNITASLFKDWDIPYDDTRRILGHGDKAITEKIYTQTRPESLSGAVDTIGENFNSGEALQALQALRS